MVTQTGGLQDPKLAHSALGGVWLPCRGPRGNCYEKAAGAPPLMQPCSLRDWSCKDHDRADGNAMPACLSGKAATHCRSIRLLLRLSELALSLVICSISDSSAQMPVVQ